MVPFVLSSSKDTLASAMAALQASSKAGSAERCSCIQERETLARSAASV